MSAQDALFFAGEANAPPARRPGRKSKTSPDAPAATGNPFPQEGRWDATCHGCGKHLSSEKVNCDDVGESIREALPALFHGDNAPSCPDCGRRVTVALRWA